METFFDRIQVLLIFLWFCLFEAYNWRCIHLDYIVHTYSVFAFFHYFIFICARNFPHLSCFNGYFECFYFFTVLLCTLPFVCRHSAFLHDSFFLLHFHGRCMCLDPCHKHEFLQCYTVLTLCPPEKLFSL